MPTMRPPARGWNQAVFRGRRRNQARWPRRSLAKAADCQSAAGDAEDGVDGVVDPAYELVTGDFKERLVAERDAQHNPGGGRGQDDGPDDGGLEVAHDLFQGEDDGGHGSVEGGGDGGGGSDGNELSNLLRGKAEKTAEDGADACADLHGRPFAAERNAAGEGGGGAEEFA